MKRALSYILLCIPLFSMAQQEDSISLRKTVSPERQILLNRFRAGRLDSVVLLLDSTDRHHNTPLLLPAERLLLYYWIERYNAIDSLILNDNEVNMDTASDRPEEQVVWNVLSYYSLEKIDMLVSWIDQSGCDDRDFNFRVRLLETLVLGDWDDQAALNRGINTFVSRFLHDEEEAQTEIVHTEPQRFESETYENEWRIGLGLGLGPTFLSGRIADYFSTYAGLSINFYVYRERWNFSLLMQPIFAKLKRDIPVGNDGSVVWEAGKSATIGNFGLTLGYSSVNNKFLKINPFIGISISDCSPTEQQILDNDALQDAGIHWGFTSMYGVDTSIRLHQMIGFLKRSNFPVSLIVRVNFIPSMFNSANPRYSGNMSLVTCGFSIDI